MIEGVGTSLGIRGARLGPLSGGEQKMLVPECALRKWPKVLMVDEMSLGPAPLVCQRPVTTLRHLADTTGIVVLLVEQHLDIALPEADHGDVFQHGRVAISGSKETLQSRRAEVEYRLSGGAVAA